MNVQIALVALKARPWSYRRTLMLQIYSLVAIMVKNCIDKIYQYFHNY